jgi:hypothetical protein
MSAPQPTGAGVAAAGQQQGAGWGSVWVKGVPGTTQRRARARTQHAEAVQRLAQPLSRVWRCTPGPGAGAGGVGVRVGVQVGRATHLVVQAQPAACPRTAAWRAARPLRAPAPAAEGCAAGTGPGPGAWQLPGSCCSWRCAPAPARWPAPAAGPPARWCCPASPAPAAGATGRWHEGARRCSSGLWAGAGALAPTPLVGHASADMPCSKTK